MDTVIKKRNTSFRLDPGLVEHLKILAKKEHRSLNNYVENILNNVTSYIKTEDNLTERICKGLEEVKLIREGKIKGYSLEEALDEL